MEQFWSYYDPSSTSLWKMVYDEANSNENLNDTVDLVSDFIKNAESLRDHCFGVIHILEGLEIEGLWFFNGPDPQQLFGANEDTSWYTWTQVGPDANELVKKAVVGVLAVQARDRQGGHGLWRLQAAGDAGRLGWLASFAADHSSLVRRGCGPGNYHAAHAKGGQRHDHSIRPVPRDCGLGRAALGW